MAARPNKPKAPAGKQTTAERLKRLERQMEVKPVDKRELGVTRHPMTGKPMATKKQLRQAEEAAAKIQKRKPHKSVNETASAMLDAMRKSMPKPPPVSPPRKIKAVNRSRIKKKP